jgi:hypothetical protein
MSPGIAPVKSKIGGGGSSRLLLAWEYGLPQLVLECVVSLGMNRAAAKLRATGVRQCCSANGFLDELC